MLMLLSQNLTVRTIKLIYNTFLKRNTPRKGILKEYIDFVGCEWKNFTRIVSTRWLFLETCCDKEFKKFEALKSIFISRGEKEGRLDIDDCSEGKIYEI